MPEKKSRIVLLREGVPVSEFAAATVKAAEVVDALTVMQTDFVPQENTVQSNSEGGFYVANLSDNEVKKLGDTPEIEAVVDDIKVYALQSGGEWQEPGPLKPDSEVIEALEAEPYPTLGPDEEQIGAEQIAVFTQQGRDILPDLELEYRLLESVAGPTPGGAQPFAPGPDVPKPGYPPEELKKLLMYIKCVMDCMQRFKTGATSDVSCADMESMLRSLGVPETEVTPLADMILCNMRIIMAPQAWAYTRGDGVRVAVVDTGIDPNHPDLHVYGGVSFVPGVVNWRDDYGHGTHVAGIIAALANGRGVIGVAPQAHLYAVKVLDRRGSGYLSWILNGLLWCNRYGMHVANLSLGSPARSHTEPYDLAYERVGRILRQQRGILLVAAAGNDYHRPVSNPARCPSFMAVSAVDCSCRLTPFTNIGPQVEICAPGDRVLSTVPGGYGYMSGTSMAAPHVSGAAALVKARHPAWHGDQIRVHLWRTATDLGTPGRDWLFGYGLANCWRAVR